MRKALGDIKLSREVLLESANIAGELTEEQRETIGKLVSQGLERDLEDRAEWDRKNAVSLKLAMQVMDRKDTPWPGASNVKFPLITVSALNYHYRAYPALVPNDDLVHIQVVGTPDQTDEEKRAIASRLAQHMTYQLLVEDDCWQEDMDRALLVQPIMGCVFKKVYYDSVRNMNRSELVLPQHLVVPYWTRKLSDAARISHIIYMTDNQMYEWTARELFLECDYEALNRASVHTTRLDEVRDTAQGLRDGSYSDDRPHEIVEQHTYLDLDGDGYSEPYVVTFHRKSGKLLRIVARYFEEDIEYSDKKVVTIKNRCYFVKYPFIPSPDGGFYDLGLGSLLMPLSSTIDTSINFIMDASHRNIAGGGLLGRGARIPGGRLQVEPGSYIQVDSAGGNLRDNIVDWPKIQIEQPLMSLIELLINYGERVAGATDVVMGQNLGQNTPANTANNMLEQGLKVFSSIYKRTYRSLTEEFKLLFELNKLYMPDEPQQVMTSGGQLFGISRADYIEYDLRLRPAAEPDIASDAQQVQQVQALDLMAQSRPGFNQDEVNRRMLKALKVPAPEEVLLKPEDMPPPPEDPRVTVAKLKEKSAWGRIELQLRSRAIDALQKVEKSHAEVVKLEAETQKLLAEAEAVSNETNLASLRNELDTARARHQTMMDVAAFLKTTLDSVGQPDGPAISANVSGMEEQPDDTTPIQGA